MPVHSMLLPTGGRIAAAPGVDASRGANSPPELLRNSSGSKSLLCRCPSSLCPVVSSSLGMVLLALGPSVASGGQQSAVLCIKAVVLMKSELLS